MSTYLIHEDHFVRLKKKLEQFKRLSESINGLDVNVEFTGEEYKDNARFIKVSVDMTENIIIKGYTILASIEHLEKGNVIHSFTDLELPGYYRDVDPICEHCNTNRPRKKSYVLVNTSEGKTVQVGSGCLKKFLGVDVEAYVSYLSHIELLDRYDNVLPKEPKKSYINVKDYMMHAAECTEHWGYQKRTVSSEMPTADIAYVMYTGQYQHLSIEQSINLSNVDFSPTKQVDYIERALEWLFKQEPTEFFSNIQAICSSKYASVRHIGYIAVVPHLYNKEIMYHKQKAKEQQKLKASEYVGKVGTKITVELIVERCVCFENAFGTSLLYIMKDDSGNIFVWSTQKTITTDSVKLTGTIKEHKEYNGVKQTVLTRCKILGGHSQ